MRTNKSKKERAKERLAIFAVVVVLFAFAIVASMQDGRVMG